MIGHKALKLGGLSATVAVALLAFVGLGTASAATVLCGSQVTSCPGSEVFASGSYLAGTVSPENGGQETSFTLTDSTNGKIVCSYAQIGGQTTAISGSPLPAHGESYTPASACVHYTYSFFNPQPSAEACTEFSMTNPPASITAKGGGAGTMTVGTAAQHLAISFTCRVSQEGVTYKCTYGSQSVAYESVNGRLKINEAGLTREAGECIGSAKLKVNALTNGAVYVSSI